MKYYGYIYESTWLNASGTRYFYIGQHASKWVRDKQQIDPNYKGSGILMQRAIKAHGFNNIDNKILKWCYTHEELNAAEIEYIDLYRTQYNNLLLNIAEGGHNGDYSKYMSEEDIKANAKQHSISISKLWQDSDYVERQKKSRKQMWNREGLREGASKHSKRIWNDPDIRQKITQTHFKPVEIFIDNNWVEFESGHAAGYFLGATNVNQANDWISRSLKAGRVIPRKSIYRNCLVRYKNQAEE